MKRVICSSSRYAEILNKLKSDVTDIVDEVVRNYLGYDGADADTSDYYVVEVTKDDHTYARIEVRAEVDYEGLEDIDEALNEYVNKFDSDAYFEPVDAGITECYINYRKVAAALGTKSIESSTITASSDGTEYTTRTLHRQMFGIRFTEVDTSPEADALEMFRQFKATVHEIHPYDDADYAWAKIENGTIKYIKDRKLVDKSYYMTADDWDVENNEWCDEVINQAMEDLLQLNKDVERRMVHN